jgi:hypothetical protein
VKPLHAILPAALLLGLITASLEGQNNQNDAEKLKIEIQERARRDIEQRDWETKLFQIKSVDPSELQRALSLFRCELAYSGGSLRVLSVRAPKEIMPAIEDAIKRLDVPAPRNDAELTIYVLVASDQADPATTIPAALNPVVNQLKGVLAYKGYRLVDTLITRATSTGSASLDGSLPISDTLKPNYHFVSFFQFANLDGKTPVLKLNRMSFQMGGVAGISGDVEVPQGQQVVVGKATMGERALILVMTSKFSN